MIDINRIKLLREELGITQKELGDKIGLSRSIVGSYEQGSRNPSFEVLKNLSNIFSCSVDYIMGISDIKILLDIYTHLNEEKENTLEKINAYLNK